MSKEVKEVVEATAEELVEEKEDVKLKDVIKAHPIATTAIVLSGLGLFGLLGYAVYKKVSKSSENFSDPIDYEDKTESDEEEE